MFIGKMVTHVVTYCLLFLGTLPHHQHSSPAQERSIVNPVGQRRKPGFREEVWLLKFMQLVNERGRTVLTSSDFSGGNKSAVGYWPLCWGRLLGRITIICPKITTLQPINSPVLLPLIVRKENYCGLQVVRSWWIWDGQHTHGSPNGGSI